MTEGFLSPLARDPSPFLPLPFGERVGVRG